MGVGNWFLMFRDHCFCEALATCNTEKQKPQVPTKSVHLYKNIHVFPHLLLYDTVCWQCACLLQLVKLAKGIVGMHKI
jgi:hypothetical protein